MDYTTAAVICVVFMLVLLMLGVPIAYALLSSSVAIGILTFGSTCLDKVGWTTFHFLYNLAWTPLPLFVFMACVIAETEIGADLYGAARNWLSRVPGGLIAASIVGEGAIAATVGASAPTIVAVGKMAVPEFERYGYNKAFSCAGLLCGGVLGPLIPPSAVFVIYSVLSNVPLGRLLIAGIIPGVILACMLSAVPIILCSRNPALGPPAGSVRWAVRFTSLSRVWPVVVVMTTMVGSIYFGVATPTEAAGVGCAAVLVIAIVSFGLRLKGLYRAMVEAALINAMLMIIVIAANFFSYVVGSSALAERMSGIIVSSGLSPILVIVSIMFLLLILGTMIEGITIMLLTIPIFVPLIVALGFDPLWFGVLFVVNMETALITPPMAINLFLVRNTFSVPTGELIRGLVPFLIALVIFLFVLVAFPQLSLWLPSMMRGR